MRTKVGRRPEEDVERLRAARRAIGPEAEPYVDANGACARQQALRLANGFADEAPAVPARKAPRHAGCGRLPGPPPAASRSPCPTAAAPSSP